MVGVHSGSPNLLTVDETCGGRDVKADVAGCPAYYISNNRGVTFGK